MLEYKKDYIYTYYFIIISLASFELHYLFHC